MTFERHWKKRVGGYLTSYMLNHSMGYILLHSGIWFVYILQYCCVQNVHCIFIFELHKLLWRLSCGKNVKTACFERYARTSNIFSALMTFLIFHFHHYHHYHHYCCHNWVWQTYGWTVCKWCVSLEQATGRSHT